MTIHLERKIADTALQYPYRRLSYDLTHQTESSIAEISKVLDEFKKRSDGEFNYCVTGDYTIYDDGSIHFGEVIYGEDLWDQKNGI